MTMTNQKNLLTAKQAAEYLEIGLRTLQRWIRNGKFPTSKVYRFGGRIRISQVDLDEWIEEQKGGDKSG